MKSRQLILGLILFSTIAAAIYLGQQEQDEVVEVISRTMSSGQLIEQNHSISEINKLVLKTRVWDASNSEDLFPIRFKPAPKIQPANVVQSLIIEQPKPVAPALPFVYLGKISEEGKLTVFVAKAERNYSIKGGEVIDGVYSVEKIEPQQVVFKYIPLATLQYLNIGERN